MTLLGNGEGHTLLILTDAESREFKAALDEGAGLISPKLQHLWNVGVGRGTAKLAEEFNAGLQAKKKASAAK